MMVRKPWGHHVNDKTHADAIQLGAHLAAAERTRKEKPIPPVRHGIMNAAAVIESSRVVSECRSMRMLDDRKPTPEESKVIDLVLRGK